MLGIVIVSYKNADLTIAFIREQLKKIQKPWKVVVVENSPDERFGRTIADSCNGVFLSGCSPLLPETAKDVIVVSTLNNLGFACGNNLGAEILQKHFPIDYFLFSNDDIIIKDCTVVEKMTDLLDHMPDVGIVGPRIKGKDNLDQSPHYRVIKPQRQIGWMLFRWLRHNRKNTFQRGTKPQSGYCYWVSGCFFMVRQKDFHAIDGFDPRTFLYSEEVILSERMERIGKKAYFWADSEVVHMGGCSTRNLQNQSLRNYLKQSNCIYYRDYLHSNPLLVLLYKIIC